MWWMLFHIHLLGELIAVHIDVDDCTLTLAIVGDWIQFGFWSDNTFYHANGIKSADKKYCG